MEKSGQSWSTVTSGRKVQGQPIERDRTFHELQDMFKGQVDGEVVYMVLQESEWKGLFKGSTETLNHRKLEMTAPDSYFILTLFERW